MCGVIGIISKKVLSQDQISNLLVQSKIRGQHATGISYVQDDVIKTSIIPKNAEHIGLENVHTKTLIGHARYSTSSFNYDFQTANDSEFILKSYLEGKHPVKEYKEASISSVILDNNTGEVHFFRNEKRPLYYAETKDTYYIASTKNILVRSGYENITKCDSCYNYTIKNNKLKKYKIRDTLEDLQ